ncbi:MAG: hypothetical protein OZX49_02082 [Immundisolibacter sp.]|nr:hypothetical protein [Immundisolibacter sp.]
MAGPVHLHVVLGRDELPGSAIQHVEKAVLGRLHDHLAPLPADFDVGQDHVLRGGVVPGLAGGGLVVPHMPAGVRIERHDGRQEQVVALALAAFPAVPRRAVADADVQQVELRVVGHRIPHRAAATALVPPLAGRVPGLGGHFHIRRLEALGRVAGHGPEAPHHLAGGGVVGGHVAAHAVLGAAVADDDLVLDDARRAGDGVRLAAVDGQGFPHQPAGGGVECNQPAVDGADVDASLPYRRAAVHDVAAGVHTPRARHLGVIGPYLFAGGSVDGVHAAPVAGGVDDAVDDDGRGLQATPRAQIREPGQAELAHVVGVDGVQRAEALFAVGAAVRQPVTGLAIRTDDARAVDGAGGGLRGTAAQACRGNCRQPT